MKKLLVALVWLSMASTALAQVPNPGRVEYTVSPDHAVLEKYVIGYFLAGATDPVQQADLPIVPPDGTGKVTQPINSRPLGFGVYVAKMRAVAGGVAGEWSDSSNTFLRSPLPPVAAPVVMK